MKRTETGAFTIGALMAVTFVQMALALIDIARG